MYTSITDIDNTDDTTPSVCQIVVFVVVLYNIVYSISTEWGFVWVFLYVFLGGGVCFFFFFLRSNNYWTQSFRNSVRKPSRFSSYVSIILASVEIQWTVSANYVVHCVWEKVCNRSLGIIICTLKRKVDIQVGIRLLWWIGLLQHGKICNCFA